MIEFQFHLSFESQADTCRVSRGPKPELASQKETLVEDGHWIAGRAAVVGQGSAQRASAGILLVWSECVCGKGRVSIVTPHALKAPFCRWADAQPFTRPL